MCSVLNAFTAASVAALTNKYYLPLGGGTLNQYLLFVVIDLLFFICAFIYLTSGLIVAWKEKSPEHRYHEEALFLFRTDYLKAEYDQQDYGSHLYHFGISNFHVRCSPYFDGLVVWLFGYTLYV